MDEQDENTSYCKTEYLTENICNRTFHSLLRNSKKDNSSKPLPHYLFLKNSTNHVMKHLPERVCHIENYHGTDTELKQVKKRIYMKDNGMFDDSYTSFNQKEHTTKRQFAQTVTQFQSSSNNTNSDIFNSNFKKNTNLTRRIKENYENNPIKWLNKTELCDYNNAIKKKMEPHKKRIYDNYSSKNIQKSFLNSRSERNTDLRPNKINAVPYAIYKNAIKQKLLDPNFNKKHMTTNAPRVHVNVFDS